MIATLTMCSLDFDEAYVPHYLQHYNQQGIYKHFLMFHSKEAVDEEYFKQKYQSNDVCVYFTYGVWNSVVMQNAKHDLLKKLDIGIEDWIINSDIDEHAASERGNLKDKILEMAANNENCCIGRMVDRITEDGSFPNILPHLPLAEQFPISACIGRKLLRCQTRKLPITRGDISVLGGNHHVIPDHEKKAIYNDEVLTVNHYKWSAKTKEKLEERVRTHKAFFHWKESARFLYFLNKGRNITEFKQ